MKDRKSGGYPYLYICLWMFCLIFALFSGQKQAWAAGTTKIGNKTILVPDGFQVVREKKGHTQIVSMESENSDEYIQIKLTKEKSKLTKEGYLLKMKEKLKKSLAKEKVKSVKFAIADLNLGRTLKYSGKYIDENGNKAILKGYLSRKKKKTLSIRAYYLKKNKKQLSFLQKQVVNSIGGLKINRTTLVLEEGKYFDLKLRGAGSKRVKWSSTNKKTASVSRNGRVLARKKGTTKIFASIKKKKIGCYVRVVKNDLEKERKQTNQELKKKLNQGKLKFWFLQTTATRALGLGIYNATGKRLKLYSEGIFYDGSTDEDGISVCQMKSQTSFVQRKSKNIKSGHGIQYCYFMRMDQEMLNVEPTSRITFSFQYKTQIYVAVISADGRMVIRNTAQEKNL